MPLGTEVNLGAGDVVLDGVAAPPKRGTAPPVFGSCLLWPNGWMDEHTTWYGSRSRPRPHCIRRGPSSARTGHSSPPLSAHVYCGHGRPSQLLLSCCLYSSPFIEPPKFYALQCFSIGTTPPKCPFTWGIYAPCNTCVLKPPDSALQTVSRSVQPFYTAHGRESLSALKCD